jgi:hypothetical protein
LGFVLNQWQPPESGATLIKESAIARVMVVGTSSENESESDIRRRRVRTRSFRGKFTSRVGWKKNAAFLLRQI